MLNNIKKCFDNYVKISSNSWEELKPILVKKEYKKNTIFCKENQRYNNEIYIESGIIRNFYSSFTGDEININFYQENEFVSPWMYRNIEGRSTLNIEALTDLLIYEFNALNFYELMRKYNDLECFGRLFVEEQLREKTNREIFILTKSAEERFNYFTKKYPGLENKIAHYHIASYLGISPISLSRLRNKRVKK